MIKRIYEKLAGLWKIKVSPDQPQSDHFANITVMDHNTTYDALLKWSPYETFLCRVPHSSPDVKVAKIKSPNNAWKYINMKLKNFHAKYKENAQNAVAAYHKYTLQYNRKTRAQTTEVHSYISPLKPRYNDRSSKEQIRKFHCHEPCKLMRVLSDNNHINQQLGTYKTQSVHRMRLQLFVEHDTKGDILFREGELHRDTDADSDSNIFDDDFRRSRGNTVKNDLRHDQSHTDKDSQTTHKKRFTNNITKT